MQTAAILNRLSPLHNKFSTLHCENSTALRSRSMQYKKEPKSVRVPSGTSTLSAKRQSNLAVALALDIPNTLEWTLAAKMCAKRLNRLEADRSESQLRLLRRRKDKRLFGTIEAWRHR